MKRVRASLLILALGMGLVLLGAQVAGAYSFTYYDGGFSSESVASATDGVNTDGPYTDSKTGTPNVNTGASASVNSYAVSASGYGYAGWWYNSGSAIQVEADPMALASSDGSGTGSAHANNATNMSGLTGIFFKITGSPTDKPVLINFSWYASVSNGEGASAVIGGGASPTFISLNGDIQWHKDTFSVGSASAPEYRESGYFWANVGDIIGINLAADASLTYSGSGSSNSMVSDYIKLDAVPLPPAVLLLGSGLLGLLALGGFRSRRQ